MSKPKAILNRFTKLFTLLLFASTLLISLQSCKEESVVSPVNNDKYRELDNAMHQLWADHMQYTYTTVDAYFNNVPAVQASLERLLRNQEDIGTAIVTYYGQSAGTQLTTLLKGHINGAVPVLEAAKNGDQVALEKAIADWRTNAQEIADFLSAANPSNWEQSHMRMHMDDHITKTITYAVDLLQKDYAKALVDYDAAFTDMMHFATTLSDGISKQFPDKF